MTTQYIRYPSTSGNGAVTGIGAIDTNPPNSDGASITGTDLYMQSAGATAPGLVNTTTQTFAGAKTFINAVTLKNSLVLEDPGAGAFTVTIQSPTLAASYTLTLPTDDGTVSQFLQTNGSGVLTWATPTAGNLTTTANDTVYGGTGAAAALTTGARNLIIGKDAGASLTTGAQNIFLGKDAGKTTSTGLIGSVGIGFESLLVNQANGVVGIGQRSLKANTTGISNVAIGLSSMILNTTGQENVMIGDEVGIVITTGNSNVAIGSGAAALLDTGERNTIIGRGAGVGGTTVDAIAIGYNSSASGNNSVAIGSGVLAGANKFILGLSTHDVQVPGTFEAKGATYVNEATNSQSGTAILTLPTTGLVLVSAISTVQGIAPPASPLEQHFILNNNTGGSITVNNQDAGAVSTQRIITGTGANVTVAADATISFVYSTTRSRWLLY